MQYVLHNRVLESVKDNKFLDVRISNDIDWGPLINNITSNMSKANTTLGVLRRNIKTAHVLFKTLLTHDLCVRPSSTPHQFGIPTNKTQ